MNSDTTVRTCFDPGVASHPVRFVAPSAIVDLLHVSHAHDVIDRYAAAMRDGARFPPVSVLRIAGRLVLADGHKRLAAARRVGVPAIPVEVWNWRRFASDQWRQARNNARKNGTIVRAAFRDPSLARSLAASTLRHWGRVVVSLATLGRRRMT